MDDETSKKLEEHREGSVSGGGDRISSEGKSSQKDFVDELTESMRAVDNGDVSKTLSIWDPTMAALLDALDNDDRRREEIAASLLDALGRDADPSDQERPDIVKLALRVGLKDASPGILDEAREARNRSEEQKPI